MTTRPTREDQLEARLVIAAKAVRRAFDRGLADLALNMSEGGALANLAAHGPLTQTELANRLHIGRASAGSLVDELERRGLVARHPDPADRRVWHVDLTKAGAGLAGRFDDRHTLVRAAIRTGLSSTEVKELRRLLTILAENATYAADEGP